MERRPGEDFEAYKKRRKADNMALKRYTKGTVVWDSSKIIKKQNGEIHETVKVNTDGTYVKGIGKLKNSQSAKNKFDALKKRALKKLHLREKEAENKKGDTNET